MKRFFFPFFLGCFLAFSVHAEQIPQTEADKTPQNSDPAAATSSEGIEMIAQRMKTLSRGLNEMAEPPEMDQKIIIPDLGPLPKAEEKESSKKVSS